MVPIKPSWSVTLWIQGLLRSRGNSFHICWNHLLPWTVNRTSKTSLTRPFSTASMMATTTTNNDCSVDATTIPTAAISRPTTTTASFYRRPLPDSCIGFSSAEGRSILKSAMQDQGLKCFYDLIQQHSSQTEPAFCGLSTLTIALNALAVDPRQTWKGPWRWYEESMLNCCVNLDQVRETGITLHTFNCLAICQGLSTKLQYVDDHNGMNKEEAVHRFRLAVQEACVEVDNEDDTNVTGIDRVLVASYSRKVLGQTGSGHFSPIAAYDSKTDSVLILDTARFKYGAHWVKLPLLYDAMLPVDPDTNRSRGYVTLINPQASLGGHCCMHHHKKRCPLPVSMLLRSELNQNPARRRLKKYLENIKKKTNQQEHEVQFQDIYKFCTKDGTHGKHFVWELTQPQLRPVDGDQESMNLVDQVRSLIRNLLLTTPMHDHGTIHTFQPSCGAAMHDCRPNRCRTLSLAPEEAMYIVYLACLEKRERERIVASDLSSTERARLQLLGDAQLFRCAMDTCDQMAEEEAGQNGNCSRECSTVENCH